MTNSPEAAPLRAHAQRVLQQNSRGSFTMPSSTQYPHQWNWDAACIALGWSYFDLERARTEIRTLLGAQWRDGMLPHVIYHESTADYFPPASFWQTQGLAHGGDILCSGLTQPPILASIVRRLHERFSGDAGALEFLREVLPKIRAWHRWLHTARDADGTGLPCLIHPWESGTDNSPRWLAVLDHLTPHDLPEYQRRDMRHVHPDERPRAEDYERFVYLVDRARRVGWEPARLIETHPFLVQDVMFCSILHRADEDLLALTRLVNGDTREIEAWIEKTKQTFDARFWNEARGLYLDYDVRAGKSIPVNTVVTFTPIYAGLASQANITRLVQEHFENPNEYAAGADSRYGLPSTAKNEAAYAPRRYWCGPVWLITNWLAMQGLTRAGFPLLAASLRAQTMELVYERGFREYYDPRNGDGLGGQDFAWTAALALEVAYGE